MVMRTTYIHMQIQQSKAKLRVTIEHALEVEDEADVVEKKVAMLAGIIRTAKHAVVYTGAGKVSSNIDAHALICNFIKCIKLH